MQQTLTTALESGMVFALNDIDEIYTRFRAEWWIGQSSEGYYRLAVANGNTSACLAWEHYFGRPTLLWPEATSKPERLTIGSLITWKGLTLKVTSFNDSAKNLIACSHKRVDPPADFLDLGHYPQPPHAKRVGKVIYTEGEYRRIEVSHVTPEGHLLTRYGPVITHANPTDTEVTRRVSIPYADLLTERQAADKRVRDWLKRIKAAPDLATVNLLHTEASNEHRTNPLRHFDLEKLKAALTARCEKIRAEIKETEYAAQQAQMQAAREAETATLLPRWLAGEDVRISYFNITPHRLRVKGALVEVTNGNSVPISEARTTLAFATKHRGHPPKMEVTNVYCGGHALREITPTTITIGCTTLQWTEIDRIAPLLKLPPKKRQKSC